MQFLAFILVYPFIWLLSILPMRVLYLISDFFYVIIYHVFGYRKNVIYNNLKLAFPEKSDKELKLIRKKFYSHFVDIFVEMIKSFTISEKQLRKRYTFKNIEVIHKLEDQGKSIMIMGSHYANWEWIFILNRSLSRDSQGYAVYNKLENKYFEDKIKKSRGRFGTNLVITVEIIEKIKENRKHNIQSIYGLLSDQSPMMIKARYFSEFMGIKVPIQTGAEFLAKENDLPVVMLITKKIKRGYFETEFKLLAENPKDFKDYQITDLFTRELEKQIRAKPEHYFWSHKRFKHRDKVPVEDK